MQIALNQDEIELAITAYVRSQISIQDTQEISIDLRAGRGETGFSATLDIRPASTSGKKTATKAATPAPVAVTAAPTPFRPAVKAAPSEDEPTSVPVEDEAVANISTGDSRELAEPEEAPEEEAPKAAVTRTSIFSKVAG